MTAIQKIILPTDYEPPQFYCPACGAPILGNFDANPCEHLVYISDPSGTGEDLIGEKYGHIFDKLREKVDPVQGDIVGEFLKKNDKESFLKFEIEFGGMSHGGDWFNITAVFDFAPYI